MYGSSEAKSLDKRLEWILQIHPQMLAQRCRTTE